MHDETKDDGSYRMPTRNANNIPATFSNATLLHHMCIDIREPFFLEVFDIFMFKLLSV